MPSWLTKLLSYWPTNQGNPKAQIGVIALIVLLLAGLATKCAAGENDYSQLGLGGTVARGEAPVMDLTYVYPDAGPKDAVLEAGVTFIGVSATDDNGPQRANFALHVTIVEGLWRFQVGLGAAYLQNTDTYNGSNVNFHLLFGYKMKTLPITWRMQHFSNGGTRSPNKGRDMLLLIWRFE